MDPSLLTTPRLAVGHRRQDEVTIDGEMLTRSPEPANIDQWVRPHSKVVVFVIPLWCLVFHPFDIETWRRHWKALQKRTFSFGRLSKSLIQYAFPNDCDGSSVVSPNVYDAARVSFAVVCNGGRVTSPLPCMWDRISSDERDGAGEVSMDILIVDGDIFKQEGLRGLRRVFVELDFRCVFLVFMLVSAVKFFLIQLFLKTLAKDSGRIPFKTFLCCCSSSSVTLRCRGCCCLLPLMNNERIIVCLTLLLDY